MKGASESSVDVFGGEDVVLKRITDRKTVDATLKGVLLLYSKKKTGKATAKAATAKSLADPANKADGKGGSKATKAKKAKAAAKSKAK